MILSVPVGGGKWEQNLSETAATRFPFICLRSLSVPSQFKGPQGPQGPVGLPGPKGPNVSRCCQSVRTLVRSNKLFKY